MSCMIKHDQTILLLWMFKLSVVPIQKLAAVDVKDALESRDRALKDRLAIIGIHQERKE